MEFRDGLPLRPTSFGHRLPNIIDIGIRPEPHHVLDSIRQQLHVSRPQGDMLEDQTVVAEQDQGAWDGRKDPDGRGCSATSRNGCRP
jgi:hypothetical protein